MKLLEQLTVVAQRLRLAPSTISVYVSWVRQFLTFSAAAHGGWKHPAELGTADVEAFLNDLVLRRRLSASAQNQALCALVFLYRQVLEDVIPQQHLGKFLLQADTGTQLERRIRGRGGYGDAASAFTSPAQSAGRG